MIDLLYIPEPIPNSANLLPNYSKTSFPDPKDGQPVSLVPLGSRKQLCINDRVRPLAKKGGDERMNEACLDMQKSGTLLIQFGYRTRLMGRKGPMRILTKER